MDVSGRPCFRPLLQDKHKEPSALPAVSVKDEESVSREVQTVRDSRLVPYQLKGKNDLLLCLYVLWGILWVLC